MRSVPGSTTERILDELARNATTNCDASVRVAAAGCGKGRTFCNRLGQCLGAAAKLIELEYANRSVPDDRTGGFQYPGELRYRLRTDVEDQVIRGNLAD